jgi:hypothetical protein
VVRHSRNFLRLATLGAATMFGVLLLGAPLASAQAMTWSPGPGGVGDNTYDGYIDAPATGATVSAAGAFQVAGWFVDKTAEGWAGADDVQVWLGTMDGGGTMLAKALFAQNRPDVGAVLGNPYWSASGFSAVIAGSRLRQGGNTLSVYAHTPGKGWWYKQTNVTVSGVAPAAAPASAAAPAAAPQPTGSSQPILVVIAPKASEKLNTRSDYEFRGYALDQAATPNQGSQGSGIDRVQVYLDGERGSSTARFVGDAILAYSEQEAAQKYGQQFANSGWRLPFKPTAYKADVHTLYIYARSVVSGRETLVSLGFEIVEST